MSRSGGWTPLCQGQQSDLGDRLWVDILVLEFNNLNDPTALRDQSSNPVAANRANERIRYTEPNVSALRQEFQGSFDEQHVEIELPASRRAKPLPIVPYLCALASVQFTKLHKWWAAHNHVDSIGPATRGPGPGPEKGTLPILFGTMVADVGIGSEGRRG